ncbi:MAG: DUF58 domain-containing protein [Clostridiales bacterium]|nr:DUF58 domain-containing protein [Clostridiales bacterium]
MLFISIMIAVLAVYLIQQQLLSKYTIDKVAYNVRLSSEEVFAGEDIFMYEEISNYGNLPIPTAKVDTELPEGLYFRLITVKHAGRQQLTAYDAAAPNSSNTDTYRRNIRSVFVLHGRQRIKRRWRVTCRKRGVYNPGSVMIIVNDLLGFNAESKRLDIIPDKFNRIVVLPRAIDLDLHFTCSRYHSGDVTVLRSLLTDPLRIAGTRDYISGDPLNRINWKSTAAHGRLMVNVEEYTERHHFNIILNMKSRDIEPDPEIPSIADRVELCITVAASLLDGVSNENIPVRLFINAPFDPEVPEFSGVTLSSDDDVGSKIMRTPQYEGKRDMINALRLLAALQLRYSCPLEHMLDHIVNNPSWYAENGSLIFISSYFSERMAVFHEMMARRGIKVIFYITSTNQNTDIPGNVEVYFRAYE